MTASQSLPFLLSAINLANVSQVLFRRFFDISCILKKGNFNKPTIVDFLKIYDNKLRFTVRVPLLVHSKFGETYLRQPFLLRYKVFLPVLF